MGWSLPRRHKTIVRGDFTTRVDCVPGSPAAWTATATPTGTAPFVKGDVEVSTRAQGYDSEYNQYVEVNDSAVVKLIKG